MSENEKINARCPLCGKDIALQSDLGKINCPECGKEISATQAIKYYQSVSESPQTVKEAHGDDYHKVLLLIDECHDLCVAGKFDDAEKKAEEALDLTETDYRAYMAMVEVKTKLYTDLSDHTHEEYLNKAIAVADVDGRADVKRIYKPYYQKRKFSAEELEKYNEENKKDKKQKLEKLLKSMIPTDLAASKSAKAMIILSPVSILLAVGAFVLTFALDTGWLALIGAALAVAAFVLFRLWFNQRESSRAFNSLLDLYDVLDGVSLSDEQSAELYKIMTDIAQRFADRLPVISMADVYDKLINLIIEINDQTINEFIKNDKFFGKMVETED